MGVIISVIIPRSEDGVHLKRCLNSIRRQTINDIEIISVKNHDLIELYKEYNVRVVSGENHTDEMNKAISLATGKYIFFCNATSILSKSVFSTLLDETTEKQKIAYAAIRIQENEDFAFHLNSEVSIYGKLYNVECLRKNNIYFLKGSYSEFLFLLQYRNLFSGMYLLKNAEIYETDNRSITTSFQENVSLENIQILLNLLKKSPLNTTNDFVYELISSIPSELENTVRIPAILNVAENLNTEKELNVRLAQKYMKSYHQKLLEEQDKMMYKCIRSYLALFAFEKEYLEVILNRMHICSEHYVIMQKKELKDYLFYADKFLNQKQSDIHLESRLEKIEKTLASNSFRNEDVKQLDFVPNNIEYSVEIIKKYEEGKLGFKTILKSIKAWLIFKMRK